MVKKKRNVRDAVSSVMIDSRITTLLVDDPVFNGLRSNLQEISKHDGVNGYILRNATSAAIDLRDPSKLVDYALLFSQALDSSQEISQLFNLGEVESILIEGKNVKMLCIIMGENKLSVFMEKNTDHTLIQKQLYP